METNMREIVLAFNQAYCEEEASPSSTPLTNNQRKSYDYPHPSISSRSDESSTIISDDSAVRCNPSEFSVPQEQHISEQNCFRGMPLLRRLLKSPCQSALVDPFPVEDRMKKRAHSSRMDECDSREFSPSDDACYDLPLPKKTREILVNEYGLALLAPLDCLGLHRFDHHELHLSEPPCCKTLDEGKLPTVRRVQSSSGILTVTTQEELLTVTTQEELDDFEDDESLRGKIPQLLPESPDDLLYCPRVLTPHMMQQIHQKLPDALKMNTWDRCFAIGRDGDSFLTFVDCCRPFTYSLVVIRTLQGHILGGFASRPWNVQEGDKHSYYGTGQSFLFATHPVDDTAPNDPTLLKFYSWTGSNDYCQICDVDKQILCMGGEGDFGWIVKDNFDVGQTGRSLTYENPPLCPTWPPIFEIADFEVYGLQPLWTPSRSRRW
jgi:hypothetical protein